MANMVWEGLDDKLVKAIRDYHSNSIYFAKGHKRLIFSPIFGIGPGFIYELIEGIMQAPETIKSGQANDSFHEFGDGMFLGGIGYLLFSYLYENIARKKFNEKKDLSLVALSAAPFASLPLAYSYFSEIDLENSLDNAMLFSAPIGIILRNAAEIYKTNENNAPLSNDSLTKRIWHNTFFSYSGAVAAAGAIGGALLFPIAPISDIFTESNSEISSNFFGGM